MKIGTQTKQNMLIECKNHKSGSLRQKSIYSYNIWLGNSSLNFLINLKLWCMGVFQASI
jgi:hypothetical protein